MRIFFSNKKVTLEKLYESCDYAQFYGARVIENRVLENKTDALCINEYEDKIKWFFVCVIDKKLELSIVSILHFQVA